MLAGTAGGALLGLIFGWLAIRRQGIYFSMITLALAQMLFFVCLQAPFTGGEDGLQGVPRGKLFGLIDLTSDLRSEEHTSELQSQSNLVCRLLLEKKKNK